MGPSYALECQAPFGELILNRTKTIETRSYAIPDDIIGQRVYMYQSPLGKARISSLPNKVLSPTFIGWFVVESCFEYTSVQQWNDDRSEHCVPVESPYNFSASSPLFGWIVSEAQVQEIPALEMEREYRSIFNVTFPIS